MFLKQTPINPGTTFLSTNQTFRLRLGLEQHLYQPSICIISLSFQQQLMVRGRNRMRLSFQDQEKLLTRNTYCKRACDFSKLDVFLFFFLDQHTYWDRVTLMIGLLMNKGLGSRNISFLGLYTDFCVQTRSRFRSPKGADGSRHKDPIYFFQSIHVQRACECVCVFGLMRIRRMACPDKMFCWPPITADTITVRIPLTKSM